ncbi:MAG TPA: hypothetical protein VGM56_31900 [Byssovorax sp.]|jgi:hypothetical protein
MRVLSLLVLVTLSSIACSAEVADSPDVAPPDESPQACEANRTVTLAAASANEALGGQCIGASAQIDGDGEAMCHVLAARSTGGACSCALPGRTAVTPTQQANADALRASTGADCVCEILELAGADQQRCRDDEDPSGVAGGFCYVDGAMNPPIGNPALAAACSASDGPHLVRLVGSASFAAPGASSETLAVQCDVACD